MQRLIRTEQREAEADRRAEERTQRAARRRVKRQPMQASRAAEPRPAQPGPGRRATSVALRRTAEPPPAREGFSGFLDRKDAERAVRVGRGPGQPANSPLEPRE
jgi:hypothetical protein